MQNIRGFTLVELMIVIVIVAILAAIAVPSYQEQAQRGRRADGKAFIMDIASRQERFYTQYSSYTGTLIGGSSCTGISCNLNYDINSSPEGLYTAALSVEPSGCDPTMSGSNPPCSRYTITLTPTFPDAKCSTLILDNTGEKGKTGTGSVDDCWR